MRPCQRSPRTGHAVSTLSPGSASQARVAGLKQEASTKVALGSSETRRSRLQPKVVTSGHFCEAYSPYCISPRSPKTFLGKRDSALQLPMASVRPARRAVIPTVGGEPRIHGPLHAQSLCRPRDTPGLLGFGQLTGGSSILTERPRPAPAIPSLSESSLCVSDLIGA